MYDYSGDFSHWQKKLDAAGVEFNARSLEGASYIQIDDCINAILDWKGKGENQNENEYNCCTVLSAHQ